MALEAGGIVAPDALDPADDNFFAVLDAGKADASVKRQIFLGRVADLQHVAFQPGRGEAGESVVDHL